MIHRRDAMLRLGRVGLGALTLPNLLASEQSNRVLGAPSRAKAKSCILVYLWGGPPQMDMWDLKPQAPEGIRSLFSPIDTNVPGIQICDQMPRIARHADKLALVRSFTHESGVHEPSVYRTLTGVTDPTMTIPRNQRSRLNYPCVGSIVARFTPPGTIPATVTIPRPIGHDGIIYAGTHAGFLGGAFDPMEMQSPGEVNAPPTHGLTLNEGVDSVRMVARHGLLDLIESTDKSLQRRETQPSLDAFRDQAFRMLTSSQAKSAFDLAQEPDTLRDRYGRNEYGEALLLSRRLVEAGVRLVTMVWYYICPDGNVANIWDNHGGTSSLGSLTGYEMLKANYALPPLDQGYSALLEDLSERGMLDETLIVMLGEFGRTPQINANVGRDHWGPCQSIVLAGGGVKGGQVYGSSDKHAAYPKDHPVSPEDVLATTYSALGISPDAEIRDQQNRPIPISRGTPLSMLF